MQGQEGADKAKEGKRTTLVRGTSEHIRQNEQKTDKIHKEGIQCHYENLQSQR